MRAQIEGETQKRRKRTTKRKQGAASPDQRESDVRDRAERATNQGRESRPELAPGAAGEPHWPRQSRIDGQGAQTHLQSATSTANKYIVSGLMNVA